MRRTDAPASTLPGALPDVLPLGPDPHTRLSRSTPPPLPTPVQRSGLGGPVTGGIGASPVQERRGGAPEGRGTVRRRRAKPRQRGAGGGEVLDRGGPCRGVRRQRVRFRPRRGPESGVAALTRDATPRWGRRRAGSPVPTAANGTAAAPAVPEKGAYAPRAGTRTQKVEGRGRTEEEAPEPQGSSGGGGGPPVRGGAVQVEGGATSPEGRGGERPRVLTRTQSRPFPPHKQLTYSLTDPSEPKPQGLGLTESTFQVLFVSENVLVRPPIPSAHSSCFPDKGQ